MNNKCFEPQFEMKLLILVRLFAKIIIIFTIIDITFIVVMFYFINTYRYVYSIYLLFNTLNFQMLMIYIR